MIQSGLLSIFRLLDKSHSIRGNQREVTELLEISRKVKIDWHIHIQYRAEGKEVKKTNTKLF